MSEEMRIWQSAKKTDPSATKANTQGGRKTTSINGYWMIQKATELWGPAGSAWGYEILDERFDEGAPIYDKETKQEQCKTVMHTLKLGVFYPGCTKPVVQFGHTPYIYQSKYGPITDTEAPKKSLMDALKKCLSMLGFSADVFMGEFDDESYIEELRNEEAIKKAENKDEERAKQKQEYQEWKEATFNTLENAVSVPDLEGVFTVAYRKMKRRGDEQGIKEFTIAKDKVKKRLEAKND